MKVDTTARGYKYLSRHEQAAAKHIEWIGTVQWEGETGALGLQDGRYYLYSSGRKPIELDSAGVLEALRNPQHITPRGRKTGARGRQTPHSVTMDPQTKEDAKELGEGNLSRGIRLAVEYVATQVHPGAFAKWREAQDAS